MVQTNQMFDEKLKEEFKQFDVSYLREVQQKILILNLKKYVWSLQNYILEKYSREMSPTLHGITEMGGKW